MNKMKHENYISKMFCRYIEEMEDKERHTDAACQAVDAFTLCCEELFPGNSTIQSIMYDKMMDCAVEFEESGFIAGFKSAISVMLTILEV